jgi:hypothetical protein
MNAMMRTAILRANAIYLLVAAAGGFTADILGAFFGRGPVAPVLAPRQTPRSVSWRRTGSPSSSVCCCGVRKRRGPGT